MKRKRRSYPEEGFQMAPMIDMVFLLLVFFMCVSSMAQADKAIPLDLPESEASKVPKDLSDRGTLSVDASGSVYLGDRAVDRSEMQAAIRELIQRRPDARIVVRADRDTEYVHIRKVLRDCAEVGAYEIVYATFEANVQ
jgi:biopolymer transport protein ExbD